MPAAMPFSMSAIVWSIEPAPTACSRAMMLS